MRKPCTDRRCCRAQRLRPPQPQQAQRQRGAPARCSSAASRACRRAWPGCSRPRPSSSALRQVRGTRRAAPSTHCCLSIRTLTRAHPRDPPRATQAPLRLGPMPPPPQPPALAPSTRPSPLTTPSRRSTTTTTTTTLRPCRRPGPPSWTPTRPTPPSSPPSPPRSPRRPRRAHCTRRCSRRRSSAGGHWGAWAWRREGTPGATRAALRSRTRSETYRWRSCRRG